MKKQEFIDELKYSLEGNLPEADIHEILSDYGDVFENALAEGREEEDVADQLGSPAKIARTILEEDEIKKNETAAREAEQRAQEAEKEARAAEARARAAEEEAQARAAVSQSSAADLKYAPFKGRLATMGSRLGAYLVDSCIVVLLLIAAFLLFFGIPGVVFGFSVHGIDSWRYGITAIPMALLLILILILGCFNILSAVFIWATDGRTPGKWLFGIRVVKINGQKITFLEALLREIVMKSVANSMTSGLLNLFSFIWGCVSEERKTVHDLVADTVVIRDERK